MSSNNPMQYINTKKAAPAQGHYSQAIVFGNTIYVSMQLAIDSDNKPHPGNIKQQTKIALKNIKEILSVAGSSLFSTLRVTIYLSDISFWEEVNHVYSEEFGNHKPARGVVPVKKLHLNLDVGFEVTAAIRNF